MSIYKIKLGINFFVCVIAVLVVSPAFAAEVYYLGGAGGSNKEKNASYSFNERLTDLLDVISGKPIDQRSGRISGSVLTQGVYNKVSGNRSKSFLREQASYLSEFNLNLQEKLKGAYNLEAQLMLRKTDDPRIEQRRDVRMKQFNIKVADPDNLYQFGDLYAEMSQFTLGSSLEGLGAEIKVNDTVSMKYFAARQAEADESSNKFQRNVFGAKNDLFLFRDSELLSKARVGFQAVNTQDDSSSAYRSSSSFEDIRNTVVSMDGDLSFVKYLSLGYEVARSYYLPDEDSVTIKDQSSGNAFRIAPQLNFGNTNFRYLYNYIQPDFYTDNGSASPDKIQHQVTMDHRFNKRVSVSLMENYYWDHLTGSSRTKRTINDDKSITFNVLPFMSRQSFRTRFYTGYNLRSSDDVGNTAEGRTVTLGTGFNDRINDKTDWGLNYEYRSYTGLADKSLSDYANRFGASLGRESQLFSRRLYVSLNPSLDVRRTKSDDDMDINLGLGFNGQYNVAKTLLTRFGHTLADTNAAKAGTNHMNNNSFIEFDKSFGVKSDRHLVLRGEKNRYMYEDGNQNYTESRAIVKYVFNF